MSAAPVETAATPSNSTQENRVYVGNLSYQTKWGQLKDFMKAGMLILLDKSVFHDLFSTKRC